MCKFAIQAVTCENKIGNRSDYISVITNARTQKGSTIAIYITLHCLLLTNINADSLSIVIAGGVMLFIGVLLILGCLFYEVLKRQTTCSSL